MAGKRAEKREALRTALIAAAVRQIEDGGAQALRARDLAAEAGCALGAIYTHFSDLDDLAFHAKAEIFRSLDVQLNEVMDRAGSLPPRDRMIRLSNAYFHFATENKNTWTALFDSDAVDADRVPEWYTDALSELMTHISRPLHELRPDLDAAALDLRTRTIFSAIHGIVLLALQNRPSSVPLNAVPQAMEQVVTAFSSE